LWYIGEIFGLGFSLTGIFTISNAYNLLSFLEIETSIENSQEVSSDNYNNNTELEVINIWHDGWSKKPRIIEFKKGCNYKVIITPTFNLKWKWNILNNRFAWFTKKMSRKNNTKIAFYGDRSNNAPALMQSDLAIAMWTWSDIAIESADIVLVKLDLKKIVVAINLSRQTLRIIKQNLFCVFHWLI
jgi:hypothetical protein